MVMGVAAVVFLGGGLEQPSALGRPASDPQVTHQAEQKDVSQIGRYQAFTFKMEVPNSYAGLIDTATGKVWALQQFSENPKWRWVPLGEGPK
jgi:hypothetical protein